MTSLARDTSVPSGSLTGLALALAGVLFIALGVILAISSPLGPFATAFWRMAIGSVLCVTMARALLGPQTIDQVKALLRDRDAWIAGLAFTVMVAFWYSGMRMSSAATTSALHNLSPLVLALSAWFIFKNRPPARQMLGIAVAVGGMVVLTGHSGSMSDRALIGDLLALASAGFLAVYYVRLTVLSRGAHPWIVMGVISMVSAPFLLVLSLATEPVQLPDTTRDWGVLLALALATQVLGQSCLAHASRRLGAFGMTAVTLTEPAFTAVLAALFLVSPIHGIHVVGIVVISAGLWVIMTPGRQRPPQTRPATMPLSSRARRAPVPQASHLGRESVP